jgi:hypothetical protein
VKRKPPEKIARRHFFRLTPEEKRTLCFVLAAVIVGVGARRYRASHTLPPRTTAIAETAKAVSLPAQKRAEAKRRKLAQ